MSNILVINASGQETRVALIEQGTISEYYLERKNEKGIVGNIYKGKVVRVLPGMQAAFVDIGLDKAAFLYVGDIVSDPNFPGFSEEMDEQAGATEGDPRDAADLPEPSEEGNTAALQEAEQAEAKRAAEPTHTESVSAAPGADERAAQPSSDAPQASEGEATQAAASASDAPSGESGASAAQTASTESNESSRDASSGASSSGESAGAAAHSDGAAGEVVELSADEALEEEREDEEGEEGDDEEEDLDEGDAAHAAAEAAMAAEDAARSDGAPAGEPAPAANAQAAEGTQPQASSTGAPEQGQRGVPADAQQQSAAREQRRGRRRGGRGRRRGNEGGREGAPAGGQGGGQGNNEPRREAREGGGEPRREGGNNQRGRSGGSRDRERGHGGGGSSSGQGHGGGGHSGGHSHGKRAQIQDLLKEGDEVLVQVVKDPIGTKGARITCHISLPGRHLVFMPTVDHVGISRRIEGDKERRRLRELVDKYRPEGTGFIVRTVAEGEPTEKLTADIKFLLGLWNEVGKKLETMRAPACIHPDLDLILRSIRDLLSADVNKVVIDDRSEYERVVNFVEQVAPELKNSIELYQGDEPIFDEFGIEHELVRASNRKVWLKSGGSIVIDQTEALVAIDVNSGRYTGKKSLEETITKINCEAAKEIVYQLRLRNIGGIIILDFIDMDKGQNRDKVFKTLQEALEKDRAKTNVLKISDIGLVEMTRKRVRESVGRLTNIPCPTCDGRGNIKSPDTLAYEIMREAQRAARKHREDQIVVNCSGEVAKILQGPEREGLRMLMMRLNKSIVVRPQPQYHIEQYDLHGKWSRPELAQGGRGGQVRRDGGGREGGERGGRGGRGRGGGREAQEARADGAEAAQPAAEPAAESKPSEPAAS